MGLTYMFVHCAMYSCDVDFILSLFYNNISSDVPLKFSGCSIGDLRNFIYDSYPDCLLNVPTSSQILSPAVCGNKLIESEEQCDCGEPQVTRQIISVYLH